MEIFRRDSIKIVLEIRSKAEEYKVKITLDKGAKMPTRAHSTDAGLDLYAMDTKIVPAKESAVFDTGVHVELPEGTAGGYSYLYSIRTNEKKNQGDGIYIEMPGGFLAYCVWYEKYQCYIAIRKLTPKECFRLQGWSDEYFEKAAFVNTDNQLYKQAGNGVTVNVVEAIGEKIKEYENN